MIRELELMDVSGGFECQLFNYGSMRDTIGWFNYRFVPGIYVLKGEVGVGGWALSEILCGKAEISSGSVLLNGNPLGNNQLGNYGCCIGDIINVGLNNDVSKMTIHKQLEYAVENGLGYGKSVSEIKEMFELSDGRFERTLPDTSGERWRISMAVGYAFEKSIYCFPWVNSKFIKSLMCLELCLKILKNSGSIIVIPTTFPESLNEYVDDYTVVDLQDGVSE